ncbi:hypothetical protein [Devosia submarina]|uniref:hypothetical protein n=1 Tax=Devosia submarina TaxID=1173082 RepID=UPI000D36FD20|nr:hypothetical protein [Devosia submarina]
MRARLLVLAVSAAFSTPALAQTDAVSCSSIFGPDSSEAQLIETYGADNVVSGDVPGPEGTTIFATTVFPDDPDRRMEFGWFDEENRDTLSYVQLSPSQVGPQGVRIGMSVAEVEAVNEAPFDIGGFGWDYGGYAEINEGKLAGDANGCFISLRFSPDYDNIGDTDTSQISGEISVPSDEPLLEEVNTTVQAISLGYPDPNYQEPAADE